MGKKLTLGIPLFFNNKTNSGIVNYVYNIICALKTLSAEQQPHIVLLYNQDTELDYIKSIAYPSIRYYNFYGPNLNYFGSLVGKVLRKMNVDLYLRKRFLRTIDVLYPYFEFLDTGLKVIRHKIHWVVDFNNLAFPEHYAEEAKKTMADYQRSVASKTEHIALSSYSLLNELAQYYPGYKSKVSILRFACTLPDTESIKLDALLKQYEISGKYLMSPNQFWEHKNQIVLIEAIRILKEQQKLDFTLVFTGSMEVNRGKGHMLSRLLELVNEYGIKDNIRFLGIIDRLDQLALMKSCTALIQPSLYEGWSTLVEEAKAFNQNIVLSNLPVHIEQDCVNSYFFDPYNPLELADRIEEVILRGKNKKYINYTDNVKQYGQDLYKMITDF